MTAFITSYVDPTHYVEIAKKMMSDAYVSAEQVGFIIAPNNRDAVLRLEMSGGEFCGNGSLAAAAYCHYKGLTKDRHFLLETSGADGLLQCEVKKHADAVYNAKGEMPKALSIDDIVIELHEQQISGSIVRFQGISHFITDYWPQLEEYDMLLEAILRKIDDKAIGIIPYKQLSEHAYDIHPFVWVKQTGSKVFERACGSGSLALGEYVAEKKSCTKLDIHQPGGTIEVEIGDKNFIATEVHFTCDGSVNISL